MRRRTWIGGSTALAAGLFVPRLQACEFFSGTLRVTHPWTRATLPGAAHAVLCMRFDEITRDDRLIEVRTPVASAARLARPMSSTGEPQTGPVDLALKAGTELELTEDGLHLQLTGLKRQLHVGREFDLELVFEQSGLLITTLNVDFTATPAPKSFTTRRFL